MGWKGDPAMISVLQSMVVDMLVFVVQANGLAIIKGWGTLRRVQT